MQFQVPQFIERDIKIFGPLSFKQFAIFGIGALIVGFLYMLLSSKSLFLFVLATVLITAIGIALIFGKFQGRSLIILIANLFAFMTAGKIYLWKKRAIAPEMYVPPKYKPAPVKMEPPTQKQGGSRLQNLSTQLEIGENQVQN